MGPGGGGFPEIKTPPPVSILPPVITTCACALKAQSGVGTLPPVGQVAQEDFLAQEAFGFSELGPIGPSSIGPSFCHFLVPILGFRLVSLQMRIYVGVGRQKIQDASLLCRQGLT